MTKDIPNQIPSGWLISKNGQQMILFIKDPMSIKTMAKFYLDSWNAVDGNRTKFKNRKILSEDDAMRTWNNLKKDGWKKLQPSYRSVA